MKQLAINIGQAVQKLEKEILPRAQQSPFEAKDSDYLQQRLAELKKFHEQALQAPVFSIRFLGDTQSVRPWIETEIHASTDDDHHNGRFGRDFPGGFLSPCGNIFCSRDCWASYCDD